MRLTWATVADAEQYVGPSKERIVSLRGLRASVIENLGATRDLFDTIDLTDNDFIKLGNFPPLRRLERLIVANNRIVSIDPDFADNLPNLKAIILTNNKIDRLSELAPLFKASSLERLTLADNPVSRLPYYRSLLVFKVPSLRFLDFERIKDKDRQEAKVAFSGPEGAALLDRLLSTKPLNSTVPAPIAPGDAAQL